MPDLSGTAGLPRTRTNRAITVASYGYERREAWASISTAQR